jgi:hypothetical protein
MPALPCDETSAEKFKRAGGISCATDHGFASLVGV